MARSEKIYKGIFLLGIIIVLPVFIGCATVGSIPEGKEVVMEGTTFSFTPPEQSFDVAPTYLISPGDELDVLFQMRTWLKKEDFRIAIDHTVKVKFEYAPELDETQKVRPDGNITLPYVGDVYVVGKNVNELKQELRELYKDILQIPEIVVMVPDFRASIKELKTDLHTAPRGLSRLATVRPDGRITFPLIGDMMVAGRTIPDVNKEMNELYEKILPGLHCDLFLERQSGSMIYVIGQVKKPGAYKILKPITLLEAMSLTEGYLPGARLSSIMVIRKHERKLVATRVNLSESLSFEDNGKLFYLMPNDIVLVPKTFLTEASEIAKQISDVLFFRGWGVGFSYELHNEGISRQRSVSTTTTDERGRTITITE